MSEGKKIGKVTHYYSKIGVAVVELESDLKVGDEIVIKGAHTDVEQVVDSMQMEHENINVAHKGMAIGLKVGDTVHEGSIVFKM